MTTGDTTEGQPRVGFAYFVYRRAVWYALVVLSRVQERRLLRISREIPAFVPPRLCLCRRRQRPDAGRAMGPQVRHRRSAELVDARRGPSIRGCAVPAGAGGRILPLPDASHHHRRLARFRVRPPQRFLRSAPAHAPGLLPAHAHRRPDVAGDQRPQRGAHDDRPGGHVRLEHRPDIHRGDRPDGVDQSMADRRWRSCRCRLSRWLFATSAQRFTIDSRRSRSSCPTSARSRRSRWPAFAWCVPTGRSRSRSSASAARTRSTSSATGR